METKSSPGYQLAAVLLEQDPGEWIAERRLDTKKDRPSPWHAIAYEMANATGHLFTANTIHAWFRAWTRNHSTDTERGAA